jgi:hypothetical protein
MLLMRGWRGAAGRAKLLGGRSCRQGAGRNARDGREHTACVFVRARLERFLEISSLKGRGHLNGHAPPLSERAPPRLIVASIRASGLLRCCAASRNDKIIYEPMDYACVLQQQGSKTVKICCAATTPPQPPTTDDHPPATTPVMRPLHSGAPSYPPGGGPAAQYKPRKRRGPPKYC